NITIEIDADLETHQTHKRKRCDLERSYEHQH
ncbi:cation transporter, partial [Streptococcus pneumoniae]